jgi:hypothetical protein
MLHQNIALACRNVAWRQIQSTYSWKSQKTISPQTDRHFATLMCALINITIAPCILLAQDHKIKSFTGMTKDELLLSSFEQNSGTFPSWYSSSFWHFPKTHCVSCLLFSGYFKNEVERWCAISLFYDFFQRRDEGQYCQMTDRDGTCRTTSILRPAAGGLFCFARYLVIPVRQ